MANRFAELDDEHQLSRWGAQLLLTVVATLSGATIEPAILAHSLMPVLEPKQGGGRDGERAQRSFVDSYKTELISDRVWRTNAQLEQATVTYMGWFNHRRLHSSIGMRPPVEHEREYWRRVALQVEPIRAQAA